MLAFSHRLLLEILNRKTKDETFKQSQEKSFPKYILKRLHNQLEITNTEIQSRPDVLEKSRTVVTIITIFRLIENITQFQISFRRKSRHELPKSSR